MIEVFNTVDERVKRWCVILLSVAERGNGEGHISKNLNTHLGTYKYHGRLPEVFEPYIDTVHFWNRNNSCDMQQTNFKIFKADFATSWKKIQRVSVYILLRSQEQLDFNSFFIAKIENKAKGLMVTCCYWIPKRHFYLKNSEIVVSHNVSEKRTAWKGLNNAHKSDFTLKLLSM